MTIQELSAVLQADNLEGKEGEAVFVVVQSEGNVQSYMSGKGRDLMDALMSAFIGDKDIADIVVGSVNSMHKVLREDLHQVIAKMAVSSVPHLGGLLRLAAASAQFRGQAECPIQAGCPAGRDPLQQLSVCDGEYRLPSRQRYREVPQLPGTVHL